MTLQTPLFQLPYLAQGDPAYQLRQLTEDLAVKLEAILQTKAVTPPGASDLLTVAGRVTALENDQAAEDAARAYQAPTFATGWGQFNNPPYQEVLKCWKESAQYVKVAGIVQYTGAATIAAGSTVVPIATLPVGYRPATSVVRMAIYQTGANPCVLHRVQVSSAGQLALVAGTPVAQNQYLSMEFGFRTVNT